MRHLLLLPALTMVFAGCAPMSSDEPIRRTATTARQCFDVDRVDNFRSGGWDKLYVRTRPDRAVYELNGVGCRDLDFAIRLGLTPDGFGGRRVCVGDGVRVINPSAATGQSTCRVRVDRALTAAEVEALPSAQRP